MDVVIAGQFAFVTDPPSLTVCQTDWYECLSNYRLYIDSNRDTILADIGESFIDTAQLFRITDYGTVGLAWVGTLCHSFGYNTAVSGQIPSDGRWWLDASTIAHELGHTCNMQHTFEADNDSIMGNDQCQILSSCLAHIGLQHAADRLRFSKHE